MDCYPPDWPAIAKQVKDEACWKCERCGHAHDTPAGYMLTVHHLDGVKAHSGLPEFRWNLAALCQRCHLKIQVKVNMEQGILWPELVSEWFRPHLDGYAEWLRSNGQRGPVADIAALRAAGGHHWDRQQDPGAFLRKTTGE